MTTALDSIVYTFSGARTQLTFESPNFLLPSLFLCYEEAVVLFSLFIPLFACPAPVP